MSEIEGWEKWIEPADDLLRQCYYRILGMISFHAPILEAIEALKFLAETRRGGTINYWGRTAVPAVPVGAGKFFHVYSWEGCEVYPGIKMDLWIYGSEYSENVAYVRKRWYRLYVVDLFAERLGLKIRLT